MRERTCSRRRAATSPLLLGLIHIVIAEKLIDREYIAARTSGFDDLRRSVSQWWPERVQERTGVPAWQLRELARRLASGGGTYILTGRGVEQHVDGTDTATAAINLALVLGLVGSTHSGYGTLTGQGNGQGGREHGQKADQLPGYRKITDPAAREHVAGSGASRRTSLPGEGIPAVELLTTLGQPGGVRALLVHGSNVVVSAPNADVVRRGLEALDFLVVCDFFFSETARFADVVLPVTQWAEEEGTMTSLEGRVIRRRKAIDPPAGVRSELWIFAELARRLESPSTFSIDPSEVFDELARASEGGIADYSGLSHALLDTGIAAHWPYPVGLHAAHRASSSSASATPTGARASSPVRARADDAPAPSRWRAHPHHRPTARALPVGRADASRAGAARRRSRTRGRSCTRRPPRSSASPTARSSRCRATAASCAASRELTPTSATTPSSCRSTSPATRGRTCSPITPPTRSRACRSSSAPSCTVRAVAEEASCLSACLSASFSSDTARSALASPRSSIPAVRSGLVSLTVVGAEADHAYNRVLLADYAVGQQPTATRSR